MARAKGVEGPLLEWGWFASRALLFAWIVAARNTRRTGHDGAMTTAADGAHRAVDAGYQPVLRAATGMVDGALPRHTMILLIKAFSQHDRAAEMRAWTSRRPLLCADWVHDALKPALESEQYMGGEG